MGWFEDYVVDPVKSAANAAVEAANQAQAAAVDAWVATSGVTRDATGAFSSVRTEAEAAAASAGDAAAVVAPVDREALRRASSAFTSPLGDARDFLNTPEGSVAFPVFAAWTPQGRKNLLEAGVAAAPVVGNTLLPGIGGQLGQLAGGVANNYFGDPGAGSEGTFQPELPPQEAPSGFEPAFGGIAPARATGSNITLWIVVAAVGIGAILIMKGAKK